MRNCFPAAIECSNLSFLYHFLYPKKVRAEDAGNGPVTDQERNTAKKQDAENKAEFFRQVVSKSQPSPEYRQFFTEVTAEFDALCGGHMDFRCERRLAVGLGNESPAERGVSLHWIYGTPVISGPASKGLILREALEQLDMTGCLPTPGQPFAWRNCTNQATPQAPKLLQALFGDVESAGKLIVLDALVVPVEPNKNFFKKDVTTPHNKRYYHDGEAPLDQDAPTPIPSVTVPKGTVFRFWLNAGDRCWTNAAYVLLESALQNRRIGAKTSSGYGLMVPNDQGPWQAPMPAVVEVRIQATVSRTGYARMHGTDNVVRGIPPGTRNGTRIWVLKAGRVYTFDGLVENGP